MHLVFATNTQEANRLLLERIGAEHQLLSYWYLKTLPPTFLRDYVQGIPKGETKHVPSTPRKRAVLLDQPD